MKWIRERAYSDSEAVSDSRRTSGLSEAKKKPFSYNGPEAIIAYLLASFLRIPDSSLISYTARRFFGAVRVTQKVCFEGLSIGPKGVSWSNQSIIIPSIVLLGKY